MAIEQGSVDLSAARRASYRVRQTFRYEYPEPIRELHHRLVVIPPAQFGDQRRLSHDVSVAFDDARLENRSDRFGNVIVDVFAPRVPESIEFVAEVTVERRAAEPHRLADGWVAEGYLLEHSSLTEPNDRILRAADDLAESGEGGLALADRINDWVYQSMTYRYDVTGVRTTAAEALALGAGVCQDYAHVMLALCRASGIPARYVSGHLLGQGGTHAWVEVVLPTSDGSGDAIAHTFDPTHASRGGLGYVTVAIGVDYSDVAPTSGTYISGARGQLTASKRVTLLEVE